MWKIAKQFDFCYGHRVWSQQLNSEFSLDNCLKCRHLHGHQGIINISLEADKLEAGMVTDFKHLNWFKKWLDDTLDHKFIMDINDPVLTHLFPSLDWKARLLAFKQVFDSQFMGANEYWTVYDYCFDSMSAEEIEIYEGLVFVPFVPTSENLSRFIYDIVQFKMNYLGVKVSNVQFYETPKSQSNYSI